MKKTIHILLATLLFVIAGCRTNNGDIGIYYGTWALDKITINGVEATSWCDDGTWTTWSFQNNIVSIERLNDLQDNYTTWGTWTDSNGTLALDFRHYDDSTPAGTGAYAAPTWIYFDTNTVTSLTIDSQSSKAMTLSTTDSSGRKLTYYLRKTY